MASMLSLFAFLALATAAVAADGGYDPMHPHEPFDTVATGITTWFKDGDAINRRADGWQGRFCSCVENGAVSSWYQMTSAMYLVDTCNPEAGLVLRTGHLQDRHTEPLVGMMACDTLKLISYCLSHHAEEALPLWGDMCSKAHYTVPACDVDCSAAVPVAGRSGAIVAAVLAVLAAVMSLA